MNIEFVNNQDKVTTIKVVHIIEHEGYGTLHQLIEPLQEDVEQKVVCTYNLSNIKLIRKKIFYIIHVTGHFYPIISDLKSLIDNGINVSVFCM